MAHHARIVEENRVREFRAPGQFYYIFSLHRLLVVGIALFFIF
jgi:hypothetical protein